MSLTAENNRTRITQHAAFRAFHIRSSMNKFDEQDPIDKISFATEFFASTSRSDRDKSRWMQTQLAGNKSSAVISADSQRASVWLADTLGVRVRLYKREDGRVETRDAGRRRGPRRHPRPLPSAAFSQNPPATPSFHPSPPYPLARTLAPSSPLSRPRPRGAIRRFTPAILPTDAVRRSYSSSSLFLRFFRSSPPSIPNSFAHPCSIAFFYRILYFSCHPRVRRGGFAFLHRVFLSISCTVDPASSQRRFLRQGGYIQAGECAYVVRLAIALMHLPVFLKKCL